MIYGLYMSASGMAIDQHRMEVVANNLANTDTTGFKRDQAVFKSRLQEAQGRAGNSRFLPRHLRGMAGGAFVSETHTDFTNGAPKITEHPLDVALDGPGMLMVKDGDKTVYSRDGRLALVGGTLVRAGDGKPVLDDSGEAFDLSEAMLSELSIDDGGGLWRSGQLQGQLGIVEFDDLQQLRKIGGNLFDTKQEARPASKTRLISGAYETSSVNPSTELVAMITTSRRFELNAQMIMLQDRSLSRLINSIPKL